MQLQVKSQCKKISKSNSLTVTLSVRLSAINLQVQKQKATQYLVDSEDDCSKSKSASNSLSCSSLQKDEWLLCCDIVEGSGVGGDGEFGCVWGGGGWCC